MVVVGPVEEIPGLDHLAGREPGRPHFKFVDDPLQGVPHGLPVLDRGAHVGKHRLDGGADLVQPLTRLPGGLETQERFGAGATFAVDDVGHSAVP